MLLWLSEHLSREVRGAGINVNSITPEQVAGYTLKMQLVDDQGVAQFDLSGALVETPEGVAITTVFHAAGDGLQENSALHLQVEINGEEVPMEAFKLDNSEHFEEVDLDRMPGVVEHAQATSH